MAENKLKPKHAVFVQKYFECGKNATEAYRQAGYKSKSPEVEGSNLLRNPNVAAAIAEKEAKAALDHGVSFKNIIDELKAIAFGSTANLLNWDSDGVSLKPKSQLTPEQALFMDSITIEEKSEFEKDENGDVVILPVKKYKVTTLARQKLEALDMLTRLLGYDKRQTEEAAGYQKALDDALSSLDESQQ